MAESAAAAAAAAGTLPPQAPTGLGFDPLMLRHQCECEVADNHPENPSRVGAIWDHLVATKMADLCVRVARQASLEEIQAVHSPEHALLYTGGGMVTSRPKFSMLKCGGVGVDADPYWNEAHTANSARCAAGTVTELCIKVIRIRKVDLN